jgi:hypothetical protein
MQASGTKPLATRNIMVERLHKKEPPKRRWKEDGVTTEREKTVV